MSLSVSLIFQSCWLLGPVVTGIIALYDALDFILLSHALFQVMKDILLIMAKKAAGLEEWAWLKVATEFRKKETAEEKTESTEG